MKTTIILVRHGETDWNRAGKFQGMSDIPLSKTGKYQASCARDALKDTEINAAYTSPLLRAMETASIILQGRNITPEPVFDFHEQNAGAWEGLTSEEIRRRYPQELELWSSRPSQVQIPDGETFLHVQQRATRAFWKCVHANPGKTILIASHMVCLSALLLGIAGLPIDEIWAHPISNAGLNRVEVSSPDASASGGAAADGVASVPGVSSDAASVTTAAGGAASVTSVSGGAAAGCSQGTGVPRPGERAIITVWNEDSHLPEEFRRRPMFRK